MNLEEYKKGDKRNMSALKRKLGIKKGEEVKTGDMLAKMQEKKRIATMGMV